MTRESRTPSEGASAAPVVDSDRIVALDVLRGFALLGILVMNIQAFAMPSAAYTNPAAYGDLTGVNRAVWSAAHVIADQKLMAIFSMLFGAGVCLFSDRATARTGRAAGLYYRRTVVLLLAGLAHGFLLFYGDILTAYALCGFWVYLLRNKRPRTLFIVAGFLLIVPSLINWMLSLSVPHMSADDLAGLRAGWAPDANALAASVSSMRGSLAEQLAARAKVTVTLQTLVFLGYFFWRVSGMMLLGMALYRTGVLTGARSLGFYRRLAAIGIPVGLALSAWGVHANFEHGWSVEYSMILGSIPNYWGSVAVALGYVSLVMIVVKQGRFAGAQTRLAAAGRMAFTNYIAQSVLCWIIFNELGLYGAVERWQQQLIVPLIWALQLWYSPRWLARFRYGPLEWMWRAATYGRVPPLARAT